ncbi:MAG TPA: tRNA pseudouridine(55) synthase TruB [Patescibacteria group bacterium]|nr:tRNA pseudouridine(55) synthase TruB [Patescibacteria group bacterium]
MNGILLVDKPSGWTSFDVVGKVRRMATQAGFNVTNRKRFPVGHTGTLDPLAAGLLVLLLGNYTKKAPELTKLDKTYEVTMRLGQTSTTGDEEGQKTTTSKEQPSIESIQSALSQFVGDIMQTPPAFSAIKINGQRAYKLARKGEAPELKARPVHIGQLKLVKYSYPDVEFLADVSSGTYIRSLVQDLGKTLGTGAYMAALRRTKVGNFSIDNAVTIQELSPEELGHRLIK